MQSTKVHVKFVTTIGLFLILVLIKLCYAGPRLNEPCDINGMDGVCKLLNDCPRVKRLLETRDVLPKLCALRNTDVVVCCTDIEVTSFKRLGKCQEYGSSVNGSLCERSSIGSDMASITEYPHMAGIGYQSADGYYEGLLWLCHGSLVSSFFVMTTAHCLQNPNVVPIKVRLGVSDLISTSWKNSPTDYNINKIIIHPEYNARQYYNDIGLVKLTQRVVFTQSVRPICLPETDIESNLLYRINYEPKIEDNGYTRPLRKYKLQSVAQNECNETYHQHIYAVAKFRLNDGFDGIMCTSVIEPTHLNVETCTGYSGAPIQIYHPSVACSYIQLGIASFGVACDDIIPGGATKVYTYIEWIESIIWANDMA